MNASAAPPASRYLDLDGERIEYQHLQEGEPGAPTLVFLHQGLGSVSAWRQVPQALSARTGCPAFWYSRRGYGWSEPVHAPRQPDYMLHEATQTLPRLLAHVGLRDIILVGHSDGATIALAYLGQGLPARAVIAVAPHVRDEAVTHETIAIQRDQWGRNALRERLQRHHQDADAMFLSWTGIWLSQAFRDWSIEAMLSGITVPALGLQGHDDETGSMLHLDTMARRIRGPVALRKLPDCRHDPFREHPEPTLKACAEFLRHHAGTPR